MKKALVWIGVVMATLFLLWGAVVAYRVWYDRKVPNFTGVQHVYVYPDMSLEEVEDGILVSGQVKKPASLKRVFKEVRAVKPGHYLIDSTCTSMYVKRMLEKGWQTPVNLTLSGSIRRESDLVRKIASQMMVDSAQVASFVGSNDSLARYGVKRPHLFTLIVPDTYQILWTASVPEIMDRLVEQRNAWWTAERKEAARRQGLTPVEVSVLASIVDGETKYVPEQPAVAAVYLNRLRTGMKLRLPVQYLQVYGAASGAHLLSAQKLPGGGAAPGQPQLHFLLRRPCVQRNASLCLLVCGTPGQRPRVPACPHRTSAY